MRKKYTYIPKREIKSIETKSGRSIPGRELLDGSYAKGKVKFDEGGDIDDDVYAMCYKLAKDDVSNMSMAEIENYVGDEARGLNNIELKAYATKKLAHFYRDAHIYDEQQKDLYYKRGGKLDGQKLAKPVGYRFTDKLAKRLGKDAYKKPSQSDIDKYNGRGIYRETRSDMSDKKPSKKYVSLSDGGMTKRDFYEGQSIIYKKITTPILNEALPYHNKYADRELVIEEIEYDTPFKKAKCFVRATGEKVPGYIILNPKVVKQYADGGMMAHGGMIDKRFDVIQKDRMSGKVIKHLRNLSEYDAESEYAFLLESPSVRSGKEIVMLRDVTMYKKGGMAGKHVKKPYDQMAAEMVGYDTWFQLDEETKAGVIAEMVQSGLAPQRMKTGAKVAESYIVEYTLADGKKVEREYKTKDDMDEGMAQFYLDNDVAEFAIKEQQKEEKKPKRSLFDVSKATTKSAAKAKDVKPRAEIKGFEEDFSRYEELKAMLKNIEAEKKLISGRINQAAVEKYIEVYKRTGVRPSDIVLESGDVEIDYLMTRRFKDVTTEKEKVITDMGMADELLGMDYDFKLDSEILEKEGNNGEKIIDIINDLIVNSEDIPESFKDDLIKIKKKVGIRKDVLDRLMQFKNPEQIIALVEPVVMLK